MQTLTMSGTQHRQSVKVHSFITPTKQSDAQPLVEEENRSEQSPVYQKHTDLCRNRMCFRLIYMLILSFRVIYIPLIKSESCKCHLDLHVHSVEAISTIS